MRGIIPAMVIAQIELYAYEYGVGDKQFPIKTYPTGGGKKRVHMKDLFDMIAGTSTGSILSGGLSMPAEDAGQAGVAADVPKNWA